MLWDGNSVMVTYTLRSVTFMNLLLMTHCSSKPQFQSVQFPLNWSSTRVPTRSNTSFAFCGHVTYTSTPPNFLSKSRCANFMTNSSWMSFIGLLPFSFFVTHLSRKESNSSLYPSCTFSCNCSSHRPAGDQSRKQPAKASALRSSDSSRESSCCSHSRKNLFADLSPFLSDSEAGVGFTMVQRHDDRGRWPHGVGREELERVLHGRLVVVGSVITLGVVCILLVGDISVRRFIWALGSGYGAGSGFGLAAVLILELILVLDLGHCSPLSKAWLDQLETSKDR